MNPDSTVGFGVGLAILFALAVGVYSLRRRRRKRMTDAVPQIDFGKTPEQHVNIIHVLPLPADTPFGNMARKYMLFLHRFDHINVLVRKIFASYAHSKTIDDGRILEHQLLGEELVYWLRKSADELICLLHMLDVRQATGAYPSKLPQNPIGWLLNAQNPPAWAASHLTLLERLNEISNALKHSFIDSDLGMVGRDEPGIYALALDWNNLKNPPSIHNIAVNDLVVRFNAFVQSARQVLQGSKVPRV